MQRVVYVLRILLAVAIANAIATPLAADDIPLVKGANAWAPDQPIPAELLAFRESGDCLALETDTTVVFSEISNYDLLRRIISQPCDDRLFACALKRALLLVGPTRFFHDLKETYAAMPQLLTQPRHRSLQNRAGTTNVLVDSVFIDDQNMSRAEAEGVFANIAADLRAGAAFETVQKKYYDAYEYAYTEALNDGATVLLHRTRVGDYGDFVVSEAENTARPLRLTDLPAQHVRPLLSGRTGDIIILRDETEHRTILYRIRDAYSPTDGTKA